MRGRRASGQSTVQERGGRGGPGGAKLRLCPNTWEGAQMHALGPLVRREGQRAQVRCGAMFFSSAHGEEETLLLLLAQKGRPGERQGGTPGREGHARPGGESPTAEHKRIGSYARGGGGGARERASGDAHLDFLLSVVLCTQRLTAYLDRPLQQSLRQPQCARCDGSARMVVKELKLGAISVTVGPAALRAGARVLKGLVALACGHKCRQDVC